MNTITMENSAIAIRRDDACLQQQRQVTYEHNGQDINSCDQPLKNLKMQPFLTRGPKEPWVAHLRKRALVDFYKKIFRISFISLYKSDIMPSQRRAQFYTMGNNLNFLATNQNHFNNFGRGPGIIPVEFSQQVVQEKK